MTTCPLNFRAVSWDPSVCWILRTYCVLVSVATWDFGEQRMRALSTRPQEHDAKRGKSVWTNPSPVLAQDSDFHPFLLPFLFSGTETYLLRILLSRAWEPPWPRKSWTVRLHKGRFEVIQLRVSKPVAYRPPAWLRTACELRWFLQF